MLSYRRKRLLMSRFKRILRWEFWPMWLFYIPVVVYILGLTIRYRGLSFTAVNPGMDGSGFVGERKSHSLFEIQSACPERVAKTALIANDQSRQQQLDQCQHFIDSHQLDFPLVLKPDVGQRGVDVAIIENQSQLRSYLASARHDSIIQEYIPGCEFGVFYYRMPSATQGHIFSLTHKCFPSVTGNGIDTLETLILKHPRLYYMAHFLLRQHQQQRHWIPSENEQVEVVQIGSHCRGSLFLDGECYRSQLLEQAVGDVSQSLSGFFFGRYDIRAADIEAFQKGQFKVIEVNGVTSESTNIYDPENSVLSAYRTLFSQWRLAFAIGQQNLSRGHQAMSFVQLIGKIFTMHRGAET